MLWDAHKGMSSETQVNVLLDTSRPSGEPPEVPELRNRTSLDNKNNTSPPTSWFVQFLPFGFIGILADEMTRDIPKDPLKIPKRQPQKTRKNSTSKWMMMDGWKRVKEGGGRSNKVKQGQSRSKKVEEC